MCLSLQYLPSTLMMWYGRVVEIHTRCYCNLPTFHHNSHFHMTITRVISMCLDMHFAKLQGSRMSPPCQQMLLLSPTNRPSSRSHQVQKCVCICSIGHRLLVWDLIFELIKMMVQPLEDAKATWLLDITKPHCPVPRLTKESMCIDVCFTQ